MEQILDTMRKYKFLCSITDQVGNNFIEPFQIISFEMIDDIIIKYIPFESEGLIPKLQECVDKNYTINLKLFSSSDQLIEETEWDLIFVDYKFKLEYSSDEPLVVSLHFNTEE